MNLTYAYATVEPFAIAHVNDRVLLQQSLLVHDRVQAQIDL